MTRNAINAIAEQNEDEEDDDDDVPQNEMDGPKGGKGDNTEIADVDNENDIDVERCRAGILDRVDSKQVRICDVKIMCEGYQKLTVCISH